MNLQSEIYLTYDDVLLVPKKSFLSSRDDPSLETQIGSLNLNLPIITAPMDTVTEGPMASFISSYGGLGIIHRFNTIDKQIDELLWAKEKSTYVGVAAGVNGDSWTRTKELIAAGADLIVLDVSHGHSVHVLNRVEEIKSYFSVDVMSANIVTKEAAKDFISAGADSLRVGVGPGAACATRIVAGVGVPQLSAISEVRKGIEGHPIRPAIVADGGVKNSGDIVKALAAGADAVMVGGLVAKFPVAAGEQIYIEEGENSEIPKIFDAHYSAKGSSAEDVFSQGLLPIEDRKRVVKKKFYRGMASDSALSEWKKDEEYTIEGESFTVEIDYDFEKTMKDIIKGVKAGLAYVGAKDIKYLQDNASFIRVSSASFAEGNPHFKGGD